MECDLAGRDRFGLRPAAEIRWKEIVCLWRVLGWEVPVKAVVAEVEGYKERFTLVTSVVEFTGPQMVELFTARFRRRTPSGT